MGPLRPVNSLPVLEHELDRLLVEYGVLDEAGRKAARAMDRWRIGKKADQALEELQRVQRAIMETRATDLADAAVQMRRLQALLDEEPGAQALLGSALGVVEAAAPN